MEYSKIGFPNEIQDFKNKNQGSSYKITDSAQSKF